MLKLLIHFNLVYIGFAIIGITAMLILSIGLGVEPFEIWVPLLLLTAIFSGRYYVRTHGDVPSKIIAWKFAFLSVLTNNLIWISLSIWIWYDAVANLVSALGWSIVIAVVLIASIVGAVFVRFLFVFGAKAHLHKMARKAKVGGSKEALEQAAGAKRFAKRIVMLSWGLPIAYIVMAVAVLIEPSIIDAIGLRALVNATTYTWQTETYRALLRVTSAHNAYSIYEIYVLTIVSFVIAMAIWLGVVLKYLKLFNWQALQKVLRNEHHYTLAIWLGVVLKYLKLFNWHAPQKALRNEHYNAPLPKMRTVTLGLLFWILWAWFFINMPDHMTQDSRRFPPNVLGLIAYIILSGGLIWLFELSILAFCIHCHKYYLKLVKKYTPS